MRCWEIWKCLCIKRLKNNEKRLFICVKLTNQLSLVLGVWYHTVSPNLFGQVGHGRVVRTLGTIVGGRVALRLWDLCSKLGSSTWSNLLITDIYPAVSAWRHVPMFPPYKNKTSTVYWCIASKLKAPRNFYWMSNMFLWVEIFLFFVCYHVVPKRHSQLDYELNGL